MRTFRTPIARSSRTAMKTPIPAGIILVLCWAAFSPIPATSQPQTGPARPNAASPNATAPNETACDVFVYGATPGGIAAAVAAARLGRSVVLAEYEDHLGGIVSNGLTNADIGRREAVGGLFGEFTRRVVDYYETFDRANPVKPNVKACRNGYAYEAHVAEQIFHEMLAGEGRRIQLRFRQELKQATVADNRLVAVVLENRVHPGQLFAVTAKVFIDATYEGDLAAMAGAAYRTGREARGEFQEPHAGRIYLRFGTTDLLPGSTGEADKATQAYCFRFHVTNVPAWRVPIQKPENYDREDYRWELEDIRSGKAAKFGDLIQLIPMPNGKFELNSDHPDPERGVPSESLDLAEENWDWPTASPARRRAIYQRYLSHNVGLVWLLQNDPEVPEALREDASQWGWCRDDWPDHGHLPRQVYVRQGRRIEGEYMLTQRDADLDPRLGRTRLQPTSIGIVEWAFDPHGCHKYDPAHPGVREGYAFIRHDPFQIPYGVIVPRTIDGLLVPVACSCSHVAYNALRMEPVFMALGQASGLAAHLAIRHDRAVRRVPMPELQRLLVERGGVITFYQDLPSDHPDFAAFQWLGARGLSPGYRATPDLKLTRGEGWTRFGKILEAEGHRQQEPPDVLDGPLTAGELAGWLRLSGFRSEHEPEPSLDGRQLNLSEFAAQVYTALAPASVESDGFRSQKTGDVKPR